jgi:hypothetical protein
MPHVEPLEDRRLLSVTADHDGLNLFAPGENGVDDASQLGVGAGFPTSYDFGDAPDSYGTTLAASGAFHSPFGPVLGPSGDRDREANGTPTPAANGDDLQVGTFSPGPVPAGDDERGVFNFRTDGVAGAPNTFVFRQLGISKGSVDIQVNDLVPTNDDVVFFPAYINAYIDWNRDGDFHEKNELAISAAKVTKSGTGTYAFTIPDGTSAKGGPSFMRVRVHSAFDNPTVLPPLGHANDGEVEDYAITLQPQFTILPDQFENNDTSATARDLGSGDTSFSGLTIDAVGDDDWYLWKSPATGPLRVDVLFEQQIGEDVDLYVYEFQGKALGSSTSFFDNERVTVNVIAGRSYLIWVYGGSVHPHYDLIITSPVAPILPDAFEQNDTAATAKDLGSGDKSFSDLTIDIAGDDDWYRWQAPANGPLTVEALFTHSTKNNIDLAVYNAAGTTILASSTSTASNEKTTLNVTAGQSYLIRVFGANGSVHRDYDLVIDAPAIINFDQFEQNDTAATARDLGSGDKNFQGLTIDATGDDDWFRWFASATGKLNVGVNFAQEPGRDVDLYLYDASGTKELSSSTQFFENEQVTIDVSAGQSYLIRVYGGSIHPEYDLIINGPDTKFAADFNADGRVDGNDMLILQTGVGTTRGAKHSDGDADADGDVDVADFQIWQKEYDLLIARPGAVASGAAASVASMPTATDRFVGSALPMSVDPRPSHGSRLKVAHLSSPFADEMARAVGKRIKLSRLGVQSGPSQSENVRDAVDRFFELLSERRSLLRSY